MNMVILSNTSVMRRLTLLQSANEMTSKALGFLAVDGRLAGRCISLQ